MPDRVVVALPRTARSSYVQQDHVRRHVLRLPPTSIIDRRIWPAGPRSDHRGDDRTAAPDATRTDRRGRIDGISAVGSEAIPNVMHSHGCRRSRSRSPCERLELRRLVPRARAAVGFCSPSRAAASLVKSRPSIRRSDAGPAAGPADQVGRSPAAGPPRTRRAISGALPRSTPRLCLSPGRNQRVGPAGEMPFDVLAVA